MSAAAAVAAVIAAAAVVVAAAAAVAAPAEENDEDEDDPETGIAGVIVAHSDFSILPLRRQLNIFPLTARREFVRAFSQGKAFCRFLHYIMHRFPAVLPRTMKGASSV